MAEKQMVEPFMWKRSTNGANTAYVGANNELVIEYGNAPPTLHIHDGLTAGGHQIIGEVVTGISPPPVLSPLSGAVDVATSPVIQAYSFVGIDVNLISEVHTATYWTIALDYAFTNVIHTSNRDTVNLTSYDLLAAGITLTPSTVYYVRVAYEGAIGNVSDFGAVTTFTTESLDITGVITTLTPSTPSVGGNYGNAVAISDQGTTAAVGVFKDDTMGLDSGAVFIYEQTAGIWVETSKLVHPLGVVSAYFGSSVSLNAAGDVLAVGAYGDVSATNVVGAGRVHIFNKVGNGWTHTVTVTPLDHTDIGWFGYSLDLNTLGDTLVVGSPTKTLNTTITTAGQCYIFNKDINGVWTQSAGILPLTPTLGAYFGHAVSISSDGLTLAIGSPYDSTLGVQSGAAFVYTNVGGVWSQSSALTSAEVTAYDQFGMAVDISDDGLTIVVGADGDDSTQATGGAVYVYTLALTVWGQASKLVAPVIEVGAQLGSSVSLSADGLTVVAGAPFQDNAAVETGMVFVYRVVAGTWVYTASFNSDNSTAGDSFGHAVSVDGVGTRAITGAIGSDSSGVDAGVVYVLG